MNIQRLKDGFVQYFDNNVIEKIFFKEDLIKVGTRTITVNNGRTLEVDEQESTRECIVHFRNQSLKKLYNIKFSALSNSLHGVHVSEDGSKLFVDAWENGISGLKKGISAYDIASDSLIWRLAEGKIGRIFVYPGYLIASKVLANIFKVDINSGAMLSNIKSGTIESLYDLGFPFVLADTISGKLSVIDVEKMLVVKKYSKNLINPSNYLSHVIRDATLRDNILSISGFEDNPDYTSSEFIEPNYFERVIDTDFYNV